MPTGEPLPELFTIPAAARQAGIGVRLLRRAVKHGDIPQYAVGAWPRVYWRDVLSWIAAQRVHVTPHARQRLAEVLEREAR